MSHSSATLGLPNLPLELRTQIYTVASSDDLIVYKNNSTGVFGLLSGPGFSQVSRQVRQENNESNQHLLRIGEVTKHHIEIDLDLFDVENSEGSAWMALFDFPREATTLTVNVNIKTPHYSFASFSSSNDGYEAIVERLTTALSDCVNLTTCAVTLNILEPEPWFLFHQQPDFLDYLDWNWLLWVDCAPVILMIKSKSLSVPNDPKDFRPDASISRYPGLMRFDDEDLYTALERSKSSGKRKEVAVLRALEEYGEHLGQADPNAGLW